MKFPRLQKHYVIMLTKISTAAAATKINVPFWSHMPRVIIQQACQNDLANHELEEK